MSRVRLNEVAEPNTPPAGKGEIYYDGGTGRISFKNDEGFPAVLTSNG